jgi:hypothetical protein
MFEWRKHEKGKQIQQLKHELDELNNERSRTNAQVAAKFPALQTSNGSVRSRSR